MQHENIKFHFVNCMYPVHFKISVEAWIPHWLTPFSIAIFFSWPLTAEHRDNTSYCSASIMRTPLKNLHF